MAVLESHRIKSSYKRLTYVYDANSHDGQTPRVLATIGHNIHMIHERDGTVATTQSSAYLQKQFAAAKRRAKNPNKTYSMESIIISFSNRELPRTDDPRVLAHQAQQALKLAHKYAEAHFPPDTIYVAVAQRDSAMMHVHLLVGTTQTSGQVVRTHLFTPGAQRRDLDRVLQAEMPQLGLVWDNPQAVTHSTREEIPTKNVKWQERLKDTITQVVLDPAVTGIDAFKSVLEAAGIKIKERKSGWTYVDADGHRARAFRQKFDKATHEVLASSGLGRAYTEANIESVIADKVTTNKLKNQSREAQSVPNNVKPGTHKNKKVVESNESINNEQHRIIRDKQRDAELINRIANGQFFAAYCVEEGLSSTDGANRKSTRRNFREDGRER